jgi:hypothetical protein
VCAPVSGGRPVSTSSYTWANPRASAGHA